MADTREIVRIGGAEISTAHADAADWRSVVAAFVGCNNAAPTSRATYTRTLKQFFAWVEESGKDTAALTGRDVLEYRDHLTYEKRLSNLTVSSYLTSLRQFYAWAEAQKYYPNIAASVDNPKRHRRIEGEFLSEEKSAELMRHFRDVSLRDFAIVNLMLRTGLRTIEVTRADVGDVCYMGETRVLKVWGKGRDAKDDVVVLTPKAWEPIKAYLATRKGAKPGDPLFASHSDRNAGQRLTTRTISGICKSGLRAIGLDGREYTAHTLRRTTACTLLKHGDMDAAQTVLRHASSDTTRLYVKKLQERERIAHAPEQLLDDVF